MNRLILTIIWFAGVAVKPSILGTVLDTLTDTAENVVETVVTTLSDQCDPVKTILRQDYKTYADSDVDISKLTLNYYSANENITYFLTGNATLIANATWLNKTSSLKIFVHGFLSSASSESAVTVVNAYLAQGASNVLALDASSLIALLYLRSTTMVQFIGEALGQVLVYLFEAGFDCDLIHLIGHSLGSHISGTAGKTFNNATGDKIGRITGLDPAGPCFTSINETLKLNTNDATFVDIIHTNAGVFGIDEELGHADFWLNDGSLQPGCILVTCDHSRAYEYYAESVTYPDNFIGVYCSTWEQFKNGTCDYNNTSLMGFGCQRGTNGTYRLRTNTTSPYGIGDDGIKYNVD